MPKSLIHRLRADCIREFRAAAHQRYLDGFTLAGQGRRTAAIYLWGYTAEMTLKAAYFRAVGFDSLQSIGKADLKSGQDFAKLYGIPFGGFHDVSGWAGVIVTYRAANGLSYPQPGFANEVLTQVAIVARHWKEVIRYHKNTAYRFEMVQVADAVEWFLIHSLEL
jgi:hypothetical protein